MTLSGTTLIYSFTSTFLLFATAVSIQINGLTNTTAPGTYASTIVTRNGGTAVDSGPTRALTFTGTLTLTSPSSLWWAVTLNGSSQSVFDNVATDQQLALSDSTGSGAGWHITVSATTFTNGTHTFSNGGTFVFTSSLNSPLATSAPTATCLTSCVLATDTTTYRATIATAGTSLPAVNVYGTAPGSGLGPITIGGHSMAAPIGRWVNVPATARSGAYTSTVTMTVVTAP